MSAYHRPVCVSCEVEMRPEKNDVCLVDLLANGDQYQIWSADKWKCPKCGYEVVEGFGARPFLHRSDDRFAEYIDRQRGAKNLIICREKPE